MFGEPPTPIPRPSGYVPPEAARWGLREAGIGLVVFVLVVVAGLLFGSLTPIDPDVAQFVVAVLGYGALVAVAVAASRRRGQGSLRADFWLQFRPVDLAIGLGLGVLAKVISVIVSLVALGIVGFPSGPALPPVQLTTDTVWIILNGVFVSVVLAPIVEELFIRGLLMQSLRNAFLRRGGRAQPAPASAQNSAVLGAVLLSAVVFAALHLYQSADPAILVPLAVSTFVLGVLNGMIVFVTQRLGGAIVSHMVFNGLAVALVIVTIAGQRGW